MNKRKLLVTTAIVAVLGFIAAMAFYSNNANKNISSAPAVDEDILVRFHSPVFGPQNAPVTIVEFIDPSCEACRALYPVVKQIMAEFPGMVRLVLRYTTFHQGSDEVVRILETARLQQVFEPVLEALLEAQPDWAIHGAPNIGKAWAVAGTAGLDIEQAKRDMMNPEITEILGQDMADVGSIGVEKTPTFFVNGQPLPSFGVEQLYNLVRAHVEVAREDQG